MAIQTPPRVSADRDKLDMRGSPLGAASRTNRPSFIQPPTQLTASLNINGNGNGVTAAAHSVGSRAATSLMMHRPGETQNGRGFAEGGRTGRSSSLSARAASPALGSYIPGLARPLFGGLGDHAEYSAGGHSRTNSTSGLGDSGSISGVRELDESVFSGGSAGLGVEIQRKDSASSLFNGETNESDDGQRVLPVRVAVRIRPLLVGDGNVGGAGDSGGWGQMRGALVSCLEVQPKASIRVAPLAAAASGSGADAPKTFKFDHVFGAEIGQEAVYDAAIAPLLARFVEGYNVTVLAYGQTSSGKTFTMGTDSEPEDDESTGIVPRALRWLFLWVQSQTDINVSVSFIEVYNEELIDLVALTQYRGVRPPIFVREDSKGIIQWVGVKELRVTDAREALALLVAGSRERQTGGTRMNGKSSRSHAIYSVSLTQTRSRTGTGPVQIVSKLHFVDLAGSERLKKTLAEGDRKREGISINSGLLALGNVISALGDTARSTSGPAHVPYRDSKLTHMLRDSLGGSAQTLLIACVSAAEANAAETINTLRYATRARNIKNCGGVNMVSMNGPSSAEMQALRAQVRKLRDHVRTLEDRLKQQHAEFDERIDERPASKLALSTPRGYLSPPSGTKIPTMNAAIQRRAQTIEELAATRARNNTLESELEQLNDTYTELLLKFNEACREIEEHQSEGFERDQRLRNREQELRRITAHSRSSRRIMSIVEKPETADALRQKRRSARSMAEFERPATHGDRVQSLMDTPLLPDLARLRRMQLGDSSLSEEDEDMAGPSAAEFDAIMEEYDADIRSLKDELRGVQETVDALRLQLTMQETKATFAEKLNASQTAQIETLRGQLAKAREAGLEEEERRRAIETELEEAILTAETQLEAADNAWRAELAHADEEWNERWDAAHNEHTQALEEQSNEVSRLCQEIHNLSIGKTIQQPQMLSPPPTAHDNEHGLMSRMIANDQAQSQLVDDFARSIDDIARLEAEVNNLRSQAKAAEARAASAEDALGALSARLAEQEVVDMDDDSEARLLVEKADNEARIVAVRTENETLLLAMSAKAEAESRAVNAEKTLAELSARLDAVKADAEAGAEARLLTHRSVQTDTEDRAIKAEKALAEISAPLTETKPEAPSSTEARLLAEQAVATVNADAEARAIKAEQALAELSARLAETKAEAAAGAEARLLAEQAVATANADAEARAIKAEQALAELSARLTETKAEAAAGIEARLLAEKAAKAEVEDRAIKAEQTLIEFSARLEAAKTQAEADAKAHLLAHKAAQSKTESRAIKAEQALIEYTARLAEQKKEAEAANAARPLAERAIQTERPMVAEKALQCVSVDDDMKLSMPSLLRSNLDLPRRASTKIMLCARNSMVHKESGSESPAEQRLRDMHHRHSAGIPIRNSNAQSAAAADKFASYPELRMPRRSVSGYDRENAEDVQHDNDADVDAYASLERADNYDDERRALMSDVAALKEAKKELQERNSQMQNLMRELGDRLVILAEENDQLEAKATERDALAESVHRLNNKVAEFEERARPVSSKSFHSATEDYSVDIDAAAAASYDLIQAQSRLNIVEADLAEALMNADEHQSHVSQLLHEAEQYRARIAEMEDDLADTTRQLDDAREENRRISDLIQNQANEAQEVLFKQSDQVARLRESLVLSEEHAEEARLTADRYANELMRVQAEVKSYVDQLDLLRHQLEDTRGMVGSEARDRDIWKNRCQDLREEVEELRMQRRQSKIRCF